TITYRIIGSDTHNCFADTGYITITVYPVPVVSAGEDLTIAVGSGITIPAQASADVSRITWTPGVHLSCNTCLQPVASPKNTTLYRITAGNEGGCYSTDELTIHVVCNNGNLFVPNTF